jgi:hypothetical protein
MIEAKVIKDSVNINGNRITTMQLKYQRFFHSEVMTHRVFSRNASSSRAIPISKMISQVWNNPAMPVYWGQNQPGMAAQRKLGKFKQAAAKSVWRTAGKVACIFSWSLSKLNVHKQLANRITEPWQWIHVVLTSTEWDNFFALRDHPAAQPEIQELARKMKKAMDDSNPTYLDEGEWHLPYVEDEEIQTAIYTNSMHLALKCSAARCARVSYMKHDGKKPLLEDDLKLYDRLILAVPPHMSPVEHQALCVKDPATAKGGNFRGWTQFRKLIEIGQNVK